MMLFSVCQGKALSECEHRPIMPCDHDLLIIASKDIVTGETEPNKDMKGKVKLQEMMKAQ